MLDAAMPMPWPDRDGGVRLQFQDVPAVGEDDALAVAGRNLLARLHYAAARELAGDCGLFDCRALPGDGRHDPVQGALGAAGAGQAAGGHQHRQPAQQAASARRAD